MMRGERPISSLRVWGMRGSSIIEHGGIHQPLHDRHQGLRAGGAASAGGASAMGGVADGSAAGGVASVQADRVAMAKARDRMGRSGFSAVFLRTDCARE